MHCTRLLVSGATIISQVNVAHIHAHPNSTHTQCVHLNLAEGTSEKMRKINPQKKETKRNYSADIEARKHNLP